MLQQPLPLLSHAPICASHLIFAHAHAQGAFVLCNMDKVNMSVAVIPMARELGWSALERGLVSSSFFWGYTLTQLPGEVHVIFCSILWGCMVHVAAIHKRTQLDCAECGQYHGPPAH